MEKLKKIAGTIFFAVLNLFVFGIILMILWNLVMPFTFGLPELNFAQAALIFLIGRVIVKPNVVEWVLYNYYQFTYILKKERKLLYEDNNISLDLVPIQQRIFLSKIAKETNLPEQTILLICFSFGMDYMGFLKSPDAEMNKFLHANKLETMGKDGAIKKIIDAFEQLKNEPFIKKQFDEFKAKHKANEKW